MKEGGLASLIWATHWNTLWQVQRSVIYRLYVVFPCSNVMQLAASMLPLLSVLVAGPPEWWQLWDNMMPSLHIILKRHGDVNPLQSMLCFSGWSRDPQNGGNSGIT